MQKLSSLALASLLLSLNMTNAVASINLSDDQNHLLIKNKLFSFDVKLHNKKKPKPAPIIPAAEIKPQNLWHWVPYNPTQPMPRFAVVGGIENGQALFICHANYKNGVHPGKIVRGNCNITWGGNEIPMPQYQILASQFQTTWIPASNGIQPNTVQGGQENGQPLLICQANYHGGMHPGKLIRNVCDIGYGGREISIPRYRLLVING